MHFKGVVDCGFTFLSYCVILLFEHTQYLQSCGAESSMQIEVSYLKNSGSSMPTKTAHMDHRYMSIAAFPSTYFMHILYYWKKKTLDGNAKMRINAKNAHAKLMHTFE